MAVEMVHLKYLLIIQKVEKSLYSFISKKKTMKSNVKVNGIFRDFSTGYGNAAESFFIVLRIESFHSGVKIGIMAEKWSAWIIYAK